jgi:hypothetical protein
MPSPLPISTPLSLGDLLDRAFRIYRARFGLLILTAAIFVVPLGIASGIISGTMMTGYFNIFTTLMRNASGPPSTSTLQSIQANGNRFIGLSYLIGLLSLLVNTVVVLALANQSIAILHQEELSLGGGIRRGLRRFLAYLGLLICKFFLTGLATLAVMLGIGCIFFAFFLGIGGLAAASRWEPSAGAGQVGLVIGIIIAGILYIAALLLLFAPLIYLSARWVAALPGLIDQGWGPIEALQKSWALTKGQSWRCVGYVTLLGLLYGVLYLSLISIAFFGAALAYKTSPAASIAIYAAVGAILPVLWQPLSTAASVLFYYDLRVRQEGYDLLLRVQQLEGETRAETL